MISRGSVMVMFIDILAAVQYGLFVGVEQQMKMKRREKETGVSGD